MLISVNKDEVGRAGEELAVSYLRGQGYTILDQNWRSAAANRESGERCNHGELDVVALTCATLVGVEVKTRSSVAFGHPAAAITAAKVARLRKLVGQWLTEHRGQVSGISEIRLDAIAIVLPADLTHYQGIS